MKRKIIALTLVLSLLVSLFGISAIAASVGESPGTSVCDVSVGTRYAYSQADHWGVDGTEWSWQWRLADTGVFSDMTYANVSGQGNCYVADWDTYPYCAARFGGLNVHPNANADAARVFTVPTDGNVTVEVSAARTNEFNADSSLTPSSLQILLGDTVVYPETGSVRILTSTDPISVTLNLSVRAGEKLRFVIGSMGQHDADAVILNTAVTYTSVGSVTDQRVGQTYTHSATAATWGTPIDHWSWEWSPAGRDSFSAMTYTYVSSYGKNMYVADWETYPYSYVDVLGVKMHPAKEADTAKTFTAPYSGEVTVSTSVKRDVAYNETLGTPTSLRILLNDVQVYPLYSDVLELTETQAKEFSISLSVHAGDRIRFVVGSMGDQGSDAIRMENSISYLSYSLPEVREGTSFDYGVTENEWGCEIPNWSWEWTPKNGTSFSPMSYTYVSAYGKNMYVADWATYPYSYADLLGMKVHPAKNADTVRTFTAPVSGRVAVRIDVSRYVEYDSTKVWTPTSLRVLVGECQVYPSDGSVIELTSTQTQTLEFSVDVKQGDRIRFVVGSMDQQDSDAIHLETRITYRSVGERELAVVLDQLNAKATVYDLHASKMDGAEVVASFAPTAEFGFTNTAAFGYCTDAKLRYSTVLNRYVVVLSASQGFLGIADAATGMKIWEVNATGSANPHSIEYLPNGNIAAAASTGGWVRIYAASQNASNYAEASLVGAHGVVWDEDRNLLWALGDNELTAYRIGGTAANPTLTELTEYRVSLPGVAGGHDLSPVAGNPNRLWVSSNRDLLQFDIPTKTFVHTYQTDGLIGRYAVKGVSSYSSGTVVTCYPNGTMTSWNTDRFTVTSLKEIGGETVAVGRLHRFSDSAIYKIRSWNADGVC